ncbi:hypothetical protein ACP70R_047487 [Stipagrostis hirtigluma subsp. patula]
MERRRRSGGRRRRRPSSSRAALRRKVRELRRLVPGGEAAAGSQLILRTADYIVRLRAKVELLRALAELYSGAPAPPHARAAAAAEECTYGCVDP